MAPDTDSEHGSSSTLVNGVIGALAGVVLFFLPFSTVIGGAVAGYLEGGELRDGAVVGAVAGIVTLFPLLLVLWFAVSLVGFFEPQAFALAVLAVILITFALLYVVGLSVIGGVIGVFARTELDL